MKKLSVGQQKLIAEFFSNIGVAWFIAGVINSFPFWSADFSKGIISIFWGISLAGGFLRSGLFFAKGVKT